MNPTELREAVEYLDACLADLTRDADGNVRSITDDAEQARFDEGFALREQYARDLARHDTVANLAAIPARTQPGDQRANIRVNGVDPETVARDRDAGPLQLRDATLKILEQRDADPDNLEHVRKVLSRHLVDDEVTRGVDEWARRLIDRASPTYTRAFSKVMTGRSMHLSDEERAALAVGTNTQGGYLLPTHLDPTIILTNAGTDNQWRSLARVETLVEGETWHGVASTGVTASMDGEIVEVSDDTPSLTAPSVTVKQAQAFVQASFAAFADISSLSSEVMMMFADARDRLEGTQMATGSGQTVNINGVFTAVHAVTGSRVTSTTAATIGVPDINSLYRAVPIRWRRKGVFVSNPLYTLAVKNLGTALSYAYSGDLTQPVSDRILGKPSYEWEDAPTTQTTTALDDEILFGDPTQYLIVDKPGGMAVEFIPNLFNTNANLPDGRRGWFAWWRFGGDALTTSAFALLVDKTSA